MRLFCFPYAGGSAVIYRDRPNVLAPEISVIPIELPGRGTRRGESHAPDMTALIDQLIAELMPDLDRKFAFFGHSMGATVAYELARALLRFGKTPTKLIVSGRRLSFEALRCVSSRLLGNLQAGLLRRVLRRPLFGQESSFAMISPLRQLVGANDVINISMAPKLNHAVMEPARAHA